MWLHEIHINILGRTGEKTTRFIKIWWYFSEYILKMFY